MKNITYDFNAYQRIMKEISPCMNDYLYVYDISQDIYYITERAVKRFAIDKACFNNVIEKHREFVYPEDYECLKNDLIEMCVGEKDEHNMTYRWIDKNGHPVWITCKGRIIKDFDQKPYLMIGCINEIGRRQSADNISGLLGETSFYQYMKTLPSLTDGYVLRIGIDELKNINGRFGTVKGDEVLFTVAECIKKCLSVGQRVYRIVAGEYLVLDFSVQEKPDAAQQLYRNIRSEIDLVLEAQQYEVLYTISGGAVYMNSFEVITSDEIQKLSQFALGKAKENGRNQCYCFVRDDYNQFLNRRNMTVRLRKAIANNYEGFYVVYQPIVNVSERRIFGAEALLRFRDIDGSMITPDKMIPILEESGLIIPVGKWVLKTAVKTCNEIRKYLKDFKITLNLSYVQLKKSAIVDDICQEIDKVRLEPSALIVELTENGELDNQSIQSVWKKLKEKGVEIAVDDFGSGYSNLNTISNLQPAYVKIDRSFTMKAMQNDFDFVLLESIIFMAHNLNGKFVVEGIENKEELNKIMKFKPEFVQGYYFGKPICKADFIKKYIIEKRLL